MAIPIVPAEELLRLWNDNYMPEKRAASLLKEIIAYETPASDPLLLGVQGVIVKLLTPKGQHIGTIHDIVNPDGSLRESHPHDYTNRNCDRVRIVQKQEQRPKAKKRRVSRRGSETQQ